MGEGMTRAGTGDCGAKERRVAVIGAGAGGLCAAKHLLQRGVRVTVFEAGSRIGGLWVYENDNGLSPTYESLHLNSEARVTAYKDFPFPESSLLYPDHREVTAYLEAYADEFGVQPHIRFRSKVTRVTPQPEGGWSVMTESGAKEPFESVVVASGHQSTPRHPPFARDFTGEYLHSHSYRVPELFRGKHVLVVGVGNSACDIAADICQVTASTTLAARSPVLMMPRMFFGVPTARLLAKIEKPFVPWAVRRWFRTMISRMAHGRMEQWGFVTPKTRTHPAGHHLLMQQFIWGRVKAKRGVASVRGSEVTFEDRTTLRFDTMIAATGYEVELAFLSQEVSPVRGHWLDLYRRVVRPGYRGLYFVGFFNVSGGGNIRMMDDQAEWIAALEAGDLDLPTSSEMMREILREREMIKRNFPDSPRYGLELDPQPYRRLVEKELRRRKPRDAGKALPAPGSRNPPSGRWN
jgi:cation diffusion facilitator CzcD-associated flavoprotein CzcO